MSITSAAPSHATVWQDHQDAYMIRLGCPIVQFDTDGKPMVDRTGAPVTRRPSKHAMALASNTILDIGRLYLNRCGPVHLRQHTDKLSQAGLCRMLTTRSELQRWFPDVQMGRGVALGSQTRGDFPNLLADSMNKLLLSHYANARRSWRAWARQGAVRNFLPADRVIAVDTPALERLEPGQQITFGHVADGQRETFALGTYGRALSFSREAMISDDASGLRAIGETLAAGAYRLEDQLAYAILTTNAPMSDTYNLFGTEHANVTTGALTAATLGTARGIIAKRLGADGNPLDWQGARLIVPTILDATAAGVLDATSNALRHESEERVMLTTSPILELDSVTEWYLATDPAKAAAVEVAFLEGGELPRLDTGTHFDSDGFKFKVTHDVTAAAVDYRAIVRSSGS